MMLCDVAAFCVKSYLDFVAGWRDDVGLAAERGGVGERVVR